MSMLEEIWAFDLTYAHFCPKSLAVATKIAQPLENTGNKQESSCNLRWLAAADAVNNGNSAAPAAGCKMLFHGALDMRLHRAWFLWQTRQNRAFRLVCHGQ